MFILIVPFSFYFAVTLHIWQNKCRDIFCLKNFDTFKRTSVRVSKMNAVAPALLTFQMLTLLKKYPIFPWKILVFDTILVLSMSYELISCQTNVYILSPQNILKWCGMTLS